MRAHSLPLVAYSRDLGCIAQSAEILHKYINEYKAFRHSQVFPSYKLFRFSGDCQMLEFDPPQFDFFGKVLGIKRNLPRLC
jgi:hypothetical protein